MQDAVATLALADRLDQQCGVLRAERERVREVSRRLACGPSTIQWEGLARRAFDAEVEALRHAVSILEHQLGDAVNSSMQARATLLSYG